MSKNTHFFGQSVFGQLISLIDNRIISRNAQKHKADYHVKKFTTKDHLISMLFGVFAKITSLREVSGAMLGLSGKTKHFQLESLPYRSTLSDANKRRSADVFSGIYNDLLKHYHYLIPDSRIKQIIKKQIEIFDSTIISLFQDILKCVGRMPANGKRKGGIKMHTVINVDEMVPKMVWFTSAATHDHYLLEKLKFDPNTIYVFDKGYNDYVAFRRFCDNETGFVTRIKDNAVYGVQEELYIDECIHSGVLEDTIIELKVDDNGKSSTLKLRKVTFYDRVLKRKFEFLTNLFEMRPDLIAAIYKLRWQIEFFFKQLKRPWSFSNLVSFCRIHLFNYLHLMRFLENPEKDWLRNRQNLEQQNLFDRQGLLF